MQPLSRIALSSYFGGAKDSEENRQPVGGSASCARFAGRFGYPLRRRTHPLAGVDARWRVYTSIALSQLLWARLVLTRTTTPVLAAGIMLNLGAISLWAVSRTAGAPFGPHVGEAELIQAADLCALLLQIYVVMGASCVWYRGLQG